MRAIPKDIRQEMDDDDNDGIEWEDVGRESL